MRKFTFLLLEILIGISLLCLLLFMGIDKFREHLDMCPTYTVVFKDVDGLSVGSPVRLMGIQVGNVIRLELLESEIYVTFRITEKNTIVPDDSLATISFTGLAGSKSLEIMPPKIKSPKNKKIIYSEEPIRINSVMQVQTTIFENVLEFCRGILAFLSKESIPATQRNLHAASGYLKESSHSMDDTLKNIKESGSDITKNTKEIKQFIDEQNKSLDSAYKSFDKLATDKTLKNNINNIQTTVEKISVSTKDFSDMTDNLNNLNSKLKSFNKKINTVKNHEVQYVSNLNNSIKKTSDNMQEIIDTARAKFNKPAVEKKDKTDSGN